MLQSIRDRSQGWLTWVIVGAISLMFALFGINYYLSGAEGGSQIAAKVNGVAISNQDLAIAYQRASRNYPNAGPTLKQQVLQALIEEQLLTQAAHKEGFYFSEQQAEAMILAMPNFQDKGQFSQERYQTILQMLGLTTPQLIQMVTENALAEQVRAGLIQSNFVLPSEGSYISQIINQTRDINFVVFNSKEYMSKVSVSDAEIQSYYNAHQQAFTTPQMLSIEYIDLTVAGLAKASSVSDAEALAYYKQNQASFNKKSFDQVKSQIISTLKQQKADQMYANVGAQLATLSYENPGSLDDVAQQLNLPLETSQPFSAEGGSGITANPDVIKAAFSDNVLNQGNNSDVINVSDNEAVVIRLKQRYPAAPKPLSSVKDQIKQILLQAKANQAVQMAASSFLSGLNKGQSIDSMAGKNKLTLQSLSLNRDKLNKSQDPMLFASVFAEPLPGKGPVYGMSQTQEGYAVFALNKVTSKPADPKTTASINTSLRQIWGQLSYSSYLKSLINNAKIQVMGQ